MSKKNNNDYNDDFEDYYALLELTNTKCTKSDIDNAYRKLAIKWHPDKNKNNKDTADKMFKAVSKAYQILSDDVTRSNYDKYGVMTSTSMSTSTSTSTSKNNDTLIDPYEMFKDIFATEANSIPNVIVKMEADIERLYTGFTETIRFTRYSPCSRCDSTGTRNKKSAECINCKGRGILIETIKGGKMGYMINEKECTVCEAKGIDPEAKLCKKCSGDKYVKDEVELEVVIPPGAYDNYYIKLETEGNYIPSEERKTDKNRKRTDVIVVIKQVDPKDCVFRRGMFIQDINRVNLADILMTVNISLAESIVGVKKEIDFLAGEKIGIDIDDIILNGDIHVIKNSGMPLVPEELAKNSPTLQTRGDLFLHFKVDKFSSSLSKQKRNRIWQIMTNTPYPDTKCIDDILQPTLALNEYIEQFKTKSEQSIKGDDNPDSDSDTDSDTDSDSDI